MSQGYIDEASTYSIVQVLSHKKPEECFGWAWKSALQVSTAIISTNHLKLAPTPAAAGSASGPYGELMVGLSRFLRSSDLPPQIQQSALIGTKRWATRNVKRVQSDFEKLKADTINFPKWLDWFITHGWSEHSLRRGDLFDAAFIRQIAHILDVPEDYLMDIWKRSGDLKVVEEYAKKQPDNDDFRYMRDAFLISTMLRGRYHESIAQSSSWQIMHHPIRYPVLPSSDGKARTEFLVSPTELYLSNIILAGAFAERAQNRIACWVDSVGRAREVALAERIDLGFKKHKEVSLELAVEAARKAGIRTHARWLEEVLDASVAIGVGLLTSFSLVPWESFMVGTAAYAVTRLKSPGEAVAMALYERESRLRDLAQAGPGRIEAWR